MYYYKLDGQLTEKKNLISVGKVPFILKIRSACKLRDANEF